MYYFRTVVTLKFFLEVEKTYAEESYWKIIDKKINMPIKEVSTRKVSIWYSTTAGEGGVHILRYCRGGEGGSLKCLHMIIGEREEGWPYEDISKNNCFHKMK